MLRALSLCCVVRLLRSFSRDAQKTFLGVGMLCPPSLDIEMEDIPHSSPLFRLLVLLFLSCESVVPLK